MLNRPPPAPGFPIKTLVAAPRVRIEPLSLGLRLIALAEDGFAVAGSRLEPGSCTRVAFQFGGNISVSIRARAEQEAESVQRFSVVDVEGRLLMRLVQALSDQEVVDWLAAVPTSSSVM